MNALFFVGVVTASKSVDACGLQLLHVLRRHTHAVRHVFCLCNNEVNIVFATEIW